MCILGEPTENKLVLAHFGSSGCGSTHGPFVHTAFSGGRRGENSIVKMHPALGGARSGFLPGGEDVVRGCARGRERGVDRGRLRLARIADAPPHRLYLTCEFRPTC